VELVVGFEGDELDQSLWPFDPVAFSFFQTVGFGRLVVFDF
jgi:hypothetical protein